MEEKGGGLHAEEHHPNREEREARKLKIGHKWVFQMGNDPKHTSKVVA